MTRTYQQWLGLHNHEGLGHNDVMALLNDWRDEREKLMAAVTQRTGEIKRLAQSLQHSGVTIPAPSSYQELPY